MKISKICIIILFTILSCISIILSINSINNHQDNFVIDNHPINTIEYGVQMNFEFFYLEGANLVIFTNYSYPVETIQISKPYLQIHSCAYYEPNQQLTFQIQNSSTYEIISNWSTTVKILCFHYSTSDQLQKIEEDLNEYDFIFQSREHPHPFGIFDCDILWYWYRSDWETSEYDIEIAILSESKVDEK